MKTEVQRPHLLPESDPGHEFVCYKSISLPDGQSLRALDFVVLKDQSTVAQVQSLWIPTGKAPIKAVVILKQCNRGRLVPFYGMREVLVTEHQYTRSVRDMFAILNVQHNCRKGLCTVTMSNTKKFEHKICDVLVSGITHAKTNSDIINSAAHYSGELHRKISKLNLAPVTPPQWNKTITKGRGVWNDAPKGNKKQKTDDGPLSTESNLEI
ncbi:uncharacterized protein MELLADRAFT_102314 [Melampsora larici-populina 98AG31]|uniref:Uncharacterized protein n=1 Tax=Melampsora larici-populina (strain 98AG31 / pathotype 3-4-7) TaxID=747676 RepID=F4R7W2_MELLP|nr:uncharacterized protein MELLADRAFT_102314 [Melampsora larici-populina 98AG31]EGG11718.1 hypothetical protein MELLADRAFT_102314 [Melampsora larici-populina 98AG31]